MIKNQEPLSLAEVNDLLTEMDSDNTRVNKTLDYLKKFSKRKTQKVKETISQLEEANIGKLKKENLIKIADIMPKTATELRSIFSGEEISLDTNETEKILQITKEGK